MILKNISAKIINIGSKMVMPDEAVNITDAEAELPSIVAIEAMGFISLEKEAETKAEEIKETVAEEKPVKRGRKATVTE